MLSDYLLRTDRLSRTNVRKLATGVCKWRENAIWADWNWLFSSSAGCGVKGLIVLALAYFGYNATAAIVLVALATMFHGAVSSGPLASMVDLSPNYAGIILGVSGMIGGMPGFISPFIVGILTQGNVSILASPASCRSLKILQFLCKYCSKLLRLGRTYSCWRLPCLLVVACCMCCSRSQPCSPGTAAAAHSPSLALRSCRRLRRNSRWRASWGSIPKQRLQLKPSPTTDKSCRVSFLLS